MARQTYVCGFLFDRNFENILLIRKNRPEKQKGRLNGVGGKVEEGESFRQAMEREFREEAGITISGDDWNECVELVGPDYEVNFYWYFGDLSEAKSMTDEPLEIHRVDSLIGNKDVLTNLKWIIPRCFDITLHTTRAVEQRFFLLRESVRFAPTK
jgi:8-oxo-dGTP diphosphatase